MEQEPNDWLKDLKQGIDTPEGRAETVRRIKEKDPEPPIASWGDLLPAIASGQVVAAQLYNDPGLQSLKIFCDPNGAFDKAVRKEDILGVRAPTIVDPQSEECWPEGTIVVFVNGQLFHSLVPAGARFNEGRIGYVLKGAKERQSTPPASDDQATN